MEDLEKAGYVPKKARAEVFLDVLGSDSFQDSVNVAAGEALETLRDVVMNGLKEENQVRAAKTILDLAIQLNDTLGGKSKDNVPTGPTMNVFINSSQTIKDQLRQAAEQVTWATTRAVDVPRELVGLPPLDKDLVDD